MTTATVGYTPGTAYSWNSYPDTWAATSSGALSWDTANANNVYTLGVDEPVNTADLNPKALTKPLSDAFGMVDAKAGWGIGKKTAETLATTDAYSRTVAFLRTLAETFATVDVLTKIVTKKLTEVLTTLDVKQVTFGKNVPEAFATADVLKKDTGKNIAEAVSVADVWKLSFSKSLNDAFNFAEQRSVAYAKSVPETFQTVDAFARTISFQRTYTEAWSVADVLRKAIGKKMPEAFSAQDTWVMKGRIVTSDLLLREGALAYSDFLANMASGLPISFAEYVPFIPGDYTVQKANIKVVLTRENLSQDIRVKLGKVYVDVPDVNDKGRMPITSTAGVTPVLFNRKFVAIPEVTVVGVSASQFGQARVSNITVTGFDVELINTANARITGTVSWNALGY
ncbi:MULTISPECIES: hypothetical protein [unclassified Bradyrhizobium]|uniref:hypothetical protein n=1 Tax=unclassified Bradyrhizobium TaxID=2631580 RepID=UPI00339727C7